MSNQERKEKRYWRRKARREAKRNKFLLSAPAYEQVFTFENLWKSFWLCRKEVSWKPSIQMFQQNLSIELIKLEQELLSPQGFKSQGFIEFNICERGKMRHIRSVNIKERVVQRCFCDYYLIPLLTHNIIYDNGASLKNKGVSFSLNRLQYHLKKYYKKYHNNNGYIVLYDFTNYFNNIDHKILYNIINKLILDEKCKKLYHHLTDNFGEKGLGLGSQVSQVSAVIFPTLIDYKIQNYKGVESSARYMDDGYVIFNERAPAQLFIKDLLQYTKNMNITLKPEKIKICKINNNFIYIKRRFRLNNNGQVILKLNKNNIYKHFRKTRKLLKLVKQNKLTINDVKLSHMSWFGQVQKYKNKKSIYIIDKKIKKLMDKNT